MKKALILISLFSLGSCGYKRYADLSVVANGNMENNPKTEKLASQVEAVYKTRKNDPLEACIDKAVYSVSGGEYMKNISIYFKRNGRKIKIVGDVYGVKPATAN
jgi:hypothetical protein